MLIQVGNREGILKKDQIKWTAMKEGITYRLVFFRIYFCIFEVVKFNRLNDRNVICAKASGCLCGEEKRRANCLGS